MFGGSELLIVGAVILIVFFGPKSLPGLGRSLGDAIRGFKKGVSGEDEDELDVTASAKQKLDPATESPLSTEDKATEKTAEKATEKK